MRVESRVAESVPWEIRANKRPAEMEWRWVMYVCAFGLQQQMSLLPNRINAGHLIFSPAEAPYRTVNLKLSVRAGHSQHRHATTAEKHTHPHQTPRMQEKWYVLFASFAVSFFAVCHLHNYCFTNKAVSGVNRKQTNGYYLTKLGERGMAWSGHADYSLFIFPFFPLRFILMCSIFFFFSHYWKNK